MVAAGGCAATADNHARPSSALNEAMAGTAVPGMAALVIRDFRPEPEQVAGMRVAGGAAVAPGDRWHLGSDGKAMTATLIARLIEAQLLSWERPLGQMLPDIAMREEYRGVTLPDLLSHRAGLPENTPDMDFFATFYTDPATPTQQRIRYLTRCLQDPPVGPVRAAPSYSNTGFLLAAACAERAAHKSFEDLIVAQVFAPLGMRTVSFDQFGANDEPQGHVEGRIANQPRDANPAMFAPAGGMRMSMGDWARFCIDQLQGEHGRGRLLQRTSYGFLHAPQGGTHFALGWGAAPNPMGLRGPALTHSGSDGNWYALVCLFEETGAGVLVAANAGDSMDGNEASLAAMRTLARTVAS
jgi:CubicO group peptidase (beta-lactamase class C family)